MNMLRESLLDVHHGIGMGMLALLFGVVWAAYMATQHERIHGEFKAQEMKMEQARMQHQNMNTSEETTLVVNVHDKVLSELHGHDHATESPEAIKLHSHSGSLASDAMQRLLRGHIHFMGVGLLSLILLILIASTSLKRVWKKVFGWTFGIGALAYPPAWILMGFRTVDMGPIAAEASVFWLFGPAVALLLGSMVALFLVMAVECIGLKEKLLFSWAFNRD